MVHSPAVYLSPVNRPPCLSACIRAESAILPTGLLPYRAAALLTCGCLLRRRAGRFRLRFQQGSVRTETVPATIGFDAVDGYVEFLRNSDIAVSGRAHFPDQLFFFVCHVRFLRTGMEQKKPLTSFGDLRPCLNENPQKKDNLTFSGFRVSNPYGGESREQEGYRQNPAQGT